MALIQCPECGQSVSDQAPNCPKCGFPLVNGSYKETTNLPEAVPNYAGQEKIATKKMFILISAIAVAVIAVIAGIVMLISSTSGKRLSVNELSISKWKVVDSAASYDDYEGTVTSNETKPFVAVMGYYEKEDSTPYLLYMEEGKGTITTTVSSDEDPSAIYKPIGYMQGKTITESDIKNLTIKDYDYTDYTYSEFSSCYIDIEVELDSKANGIFFVEISDDMTKEVKYNCKMVIIDGKGSYSYYLSGLPLKSRGVSVTLTPKYFCSGSALTEKEYEVKSDFSMDESEGVYYTTFMGEQEISVPDKKDGFVLYSEELVSGGRKEDRGEMEYDYAFLKNNYCTLTTYDFLDKEEYTKTPDYELQVKGYISWIELDS